MTQNATTRIARVFVDEVLECGQREGVDVRSFLDELGFSLTDLDTMAPADFATLWLEMAFQIGDEFFRLGKRPMAPGSFTLMGHAVRGAPTFEVALRRALRFLRVVIEEPYGVVEVGNDRCTVRLVESGAARSAFAYRTFFLILHGLNCWLVRERISLLHIQFPCAPPSGQDDYGDFFGRPVIFNAIEAAIQFDARYLQRSVQRTEEDLKVFLRTTPETLLRGYRPVLSLKRRVQDLLDGYDQSDWPSTEDICAALNMSRSTLHRRLKGEGQTLRLIKDEKHKSQVTYLLKSTEIPVAEIARRLGYAEPSAFHRAFRNWFATTPNAMRKGLARSVGKQ